SRGNGLRLLVPMVRSHSSPLLFLLIVFSAANSFNREVKEIFLGLKSAILVNVPLTRFGNANGQNASRFARQRVHGAHRKRG
ncbi:MAG: hypothetical protein AAGF13_03225, partial [Pseudomonadota bacterium]